MINGLITAIRTLTRIPIKGKDANSFASSLPWFPFVGFLLASVLSIIVLIMNNLNFGWNEAIAIILIIASSLLTGALHLDGFSDWADSLGAIGNKEKMLTIMKDSNSGAFGNVAIVLLLLSKWVIITKLLELNLIINGLFISFIISRLAMVYLSVTLPYARIEGGTGELFIKEANKIHLLIATVTSLLLLFIIGNFTAILFLLPALIIVNLWSIWCRKYVNGITGDLLGAGSEIIEVSIMFGVVSFYNTIFNFVNHLFAGI